MAAISDQVQRTFDLIAQHLGRAFSFEDLARFTESLRDGLPLLPSLETRWLP